MKTFRLKYDKLTQLYILSAKTSFGTWEIAEMSKEKEPLYRFAKANNYKVKEKK